VPVSYNFIIKMKLLSLSVLFSVFSVAVVNCFYQYPPQATAAFALPTSDTNLDSYLNEVYFCYDTNLDGMLDKNETHNMLRGQLGEQNCDSFSKLDSVLLTQDNKQMFDNLKSMLTTYPSQNVRL
jgi:hypothetical protein